MASPGIPVLEVGGTHVSSALVDADTGTLVGAASRIELSSAASAARIVDTLVQAADAVPVSGAATWAIAMPDPFDYERGVALFDGVGKFESLRGLDLRAALTTRLPGRARNVLFLNDADAFTLGEWAFGAADGHRRCVGITLGTGVGSGWIVDGRIVSSGPGVPPGGRAHRLLIDGAPLEDTVSSRAIRRSYRALAGDGADVRVIAERARDGESAARTVLRHAMRALGTALGRCVRDFGADVVVIGGSMARSWDLFQASFGSGFAEAGKPPALRLADHPEDAPLLGAARFARDGG